MTVSFIPGTLPKENQHIIEKKVNEILSDIVTINIKITNLLEGSLIRVWSIDKRFCDLNSYFLDYEPIINYVEFLDSEYSTSIRSHKDHLFVINITHSRRKLYIFKTLVKNMFSKTTKTGKCNLFIEVP